MVLVLSHHVVLPPAVASWIHLRVIRRGKCVLKCVCMCVYCKLHVAGFSVVLTAELNWHYCDFFYTRSFCSRVIFLTHFSVFLPQLPLILCLKELMRNVFFKGVNEVKNQDFELYKCATEFQI